MSAKLINADQIVKELSKSGEQYYKEIVKKFGPEILLENKEINKPKLAGIIFTNKHKREELNKITYKYIAKKIQDEAQKEKQKDIIIDAPLLIETKLNEICDVVISIIAEEEVKIRRICKRDNIDEKTAKQRINSQLSDETYIKNSNYVLINNDLDLVQEAEKFAKLLNKTNTVEKREK